MSDGKAARLWKVGLPILGLLMATAIFMIGVVELIRLLAEILR